MVDMGTPADSRRARTRIVRTAGPERQRGRCGPVDGQPRARQTWAGGAAGPLRRWTRAGGP